MNFSSSYLSSPASSIDEILITKLLLSHDPDGRLLDSEQLLREIEHMFYAATPFHDDDEHSDANLINRSSKIEIVALREVLEHIDTMHKISQEMLPKNSNQEDLHKQTMILFDLLGNYRWDAKITLVLTAFVAIYAEFCLIMQLRPFIPLANSLAILRQLPENISNFKPQLRALRKLVEMMVDVTKYIIKFEALPVEVVKPDMETLSVTKSQIYAAAYWIVRSTVTCSIQIRSLKAMKLNQVHYSLVAAWELVSFEYWLSSIYSCLRQQVDGCHQEIEAKLHQMLLNISKETHVDNHEILHMFCSLNNDLPLKDCSMQVKRGLSELKNKVIVLLVSKPELLPVGEVLFLFHQTYDHSLNKKVDGDYEIVWVAISDTWTEAETKIFNFFLSSLPWYSIRKPWSLNPAVVNFIKQQWSFEDKAIMVVLDSKGTITNTNALDMVMIWGSKAYPFSVSRENELWQAEHLNLQMLINDIDPLLAQWAEEDRNICIYGSGNIDWIREFSDKVKQVKSAGVQLEMVYVGKNKPTSKVRDILTTINNEMHTSLIPFTAIQFFWLRLESMRESKLRLGKAAESDPILEEVSALLDANDKDEGWAVFGRGFSDGFIRLQGRAVIDHLNQFPQWGENVVHFGFIGALRYAIEPILYPVPCNHTDVIPYSEGLTKGKMVCPRCKRLMKKFIIYESAT